MLAVAFRVYQPDGDQTLAPPRRDPGRTDRDHRKLARPAGPGPGELEKDANGTGLGLPIAREIANAHGGDLKIEDSVRGARFVLRIARCGPAKTEAPGTR